MARAAGAVPLVAAVVAAAALAGAAVFTVNQAACPDPGHYVVDGSGARLVGGCVDRDELPATNQAPAVQAGQAAGSGGFSQSRP